MQYISKLREEQQRKIEAMDGILRMLPYLEDRIKDLKHRVEELDVMLSTGCVSSVRTEKQPSGNSVSYGEARFEKLILDKAELEAEQRSLEMYKKTILHLLKSLSEEERYYLSRRYEKKMTYEEIAFETNQSRDTVRRIISRILIKL